jgi:hypothetical protein
MLTIAPTDANHPPQLQERLHYRQVTMEALHQSKLNKTTLKGE